MKRIIEIDILRAFATILLLIHHSGVYQFKIGGISLKSLMSPQMNFALLGVFILLSGYLLGVTFRTRPSLRLKDYYIKRVGKLYPPYILAFFAFLLIIKADMDVGNFWIHIFGLQIILAPNLSTPIFTLWYFGMLITYLIIFPLGIKKSKNIGQSMFIFGTMYAVFLILHNLLEIIDVRFFYFYWIFAAGSLLAFHSNLVSKLKPNKPVNTIAIILVLLTGAFLMVNRTAYVQKIHWSHIFGANIFMLSFAYIAYLISARIKSAENVQNIASFISAGSYFTYMFHRPIWRILLFIFPSRERPIIFLIQFFIGAPLTVFLSSKLQPMYEKLRIPPHQAGV